MWSGATFPDQMARRSGLAWACMPPGVWSMVALLTVAWQKLQVPVETCLAICFPSVAYQPDHCTASDMEKTGTATLVLGSISLVTILSMTSKMSGLK